MGPSFRRAGDRRMGPSFRVGTRLRPSLGSSRMALAL
jgi:hypothetical protein